MFVAKQAKLHDTTRLGLDVPIGGDLLPALDGAPLASRRAVMGVAAWGWHSPPPAEEGVGMWSCCPRRRPYIVD